MLSELYIKNFAIIDELRVGFGSGLNVLTGETGAGKSIIVDALGAALGLRVGAEVVRSGADQALAEAVFHLRPGLAGQASRPDLSAVLEEHGLDDEDGSLILSREVNRASGRTVARVNSRTVPLSVLQRLGQLLIDIHGQSEHLSLLRVREHLDYLDRYAGLTGPRTEVYELVKTLRSVRADLERMDQDERESAREIDLLNYQIQEITAAALVPDEEEQLVRDRARLRNAERIRQLAHSVYAMLSGEEEQLGAVDLLAQADRQLQELTSVDASLEADMQSLESARYGLEEVAQNVRSYIDSVEDDPGRLNDVEERLELIAELKRKYGGTVAEILRYRDEAQDRLDRLSNRAYYQDQLKEREIALLQQIATRASELSIQRRSVAERLAQEVHGELAALNMGSTRFEVAFAVVPDSGGVPHELPGTIAPVGEPVAFDSTGIDKVEFLVSTNPGEAPKPLARIASGGEMARLMLALKTILTRADAIPCLVFDEIDVGVGARSGMRVGEKLWRLTGNHQVLCITHMPQIACMADVHLSVSKIVEGGRTRTSVEELEGRRQLEELATMLAGTTEFDAAIASAQELLDRARELKATAKSGGRKK